MCGELGRLAYRLVDQGALSNQRLIQPADRIRAVELAIDEFAPSPPTSESGGSALHLRLRKRRHPG